jgi:hypothetical protein
MLNQYVAIEHDNTRPHSSLPVLRLANNAKLVKQSYINLDQFFTIEAAHLQKWRDGKRQLDATSIKNLELAFLNFISKDRNITPRKAKPENYILSPLDYRQREQLTAQWLGVNDTRFVIPPRKDSAVAIVKPSTPTPPSTPPPKFPLCARANGAQLFQTSKMGMIGK